MRLPSKEVLELRSALRRRRFGIDRSIWLFTAIHGCVLAILIWGNTELSFRLSGGLLQASHASNGLLVTYQAT